MLVFGVEVYRNQEDIKKSIYFFRLYIKKTEVW